MSSVLIAAGSICLLYFLLLAIKHVDFCIIWLLGAVILCGWGGYLRYRTVHPDSWRMPVAVSILLAVCLIAGGLSFGITEGRMIAAMSSQTGEDLDYVIVLGAQVKKTVPSKALRLRLEKACEYLQEHPDTIAVLSGGQGPGEEITEAACMYQYLTEHGLSGDRLLLEDQSTTTRENLLYSAQVIADSRKEQNTDQIWNDKIGLVSNNFHIYRAVKLAEKTGYKNVYGIASPSDWKLQIHYMVREYFAILKAKIRGDI